MIRPIDSDEALRLVKSGAVLVLDVRTPQENVGSRIKNSLLIPLDELEEKTNQIPRDRPILVYCRSGSRSMLASRILESHGFQEILNLKEGILDCLEK
jgi:rhodanese-related sulfurtransferase